MTPHHDFDTLDAKAQALDATLEQSGMAQLGLESLLQVLPAFPYTLSTFQRDLISSLYPSSMLSFEGESGVSNCVASVLVLEGLEELTRDRAKDIIKGSQSVLDWLHHVLEKLHETTDGFLSQMGMLEHRLTPYAGKSKTPGSFVYKSIVRNLSHDGEVHPALVSKQLDEFLVKTKTVRSSCDRAEFTRLLQSMASFQASSVAKENTDAIDAIFLELKDYLKTILPEVTAGPLEHLEVIEDRVLMYDPVDYISTHRFYAYLPTHARGAVSTVISGIVRVDQDSDLKQEVDYLSSKECDDILNVIKRHIHDFDDHDRFKQVTLHLREIQSELFEKYTKAKRMRKNKVDAKTYVILMNLCASLVYGLHVKALNKSVSVITAALRYVAKSVQALQTHHTAIEQP